MPPARPQREHIANRLREERTRVLRLLGRYGERLADTAQASAANLSPFSSADGGSGAFDRELGAQEASRLTRELGEIDAALEARARRGRRTP